MMIRESISKTGREVMYIAMNGLGNGGPSSYSQQELALNEAIPKALDAASLAAYQRLYAFAQQDYPGQIPGDTSPMKLAEIDGSQEAKDTARFIISLQEVRNQLPAGGPLSVYDASTLYDIHQTIANLVDLLTPHKNLHAHIDSAILAAAPGLGAASTLRDLKDATYLTYAAKARTTGQDAKDYVGRQEQPIRTVVDAPTSGVDTPKPGSGLPWWFWAGSVAGLAWLFWPRRR